MEVMADAAPAEVEKEVIIVVVVAAAAAAVVAVASVAAAAAAGVMGGCYLALPTASVRVLP